jgi:AcrR family transcriptional regulator
VSSPKAGKTNKQAKEDSERELLEAGLEELVNAERVNPMSHLKVRTICARAGRTSGAFYMHWPGGIDEYRMALGELLLGEVAGMDEELVELREVAGQASRGSTPLSAITDVAEADLRLLLENETWDTVELLTLAWGRDPNRLREAAARGYLAADHLTGEAYDVVLQAFGREPRDPFTSEEIAAVLQAFIEGFGLRCKVEPQGVGGAGAGRLYAVGVAALLAAMTRGPGDSADVAEVLADALGTPDAPQG